MQDWPWRAEALVLLVASWPLYQALARSELPAPTLAPMQLCQCSNRTEGGEHAVLDAYSLPYSSPGNRSFVLQLQEAELLELLLYTEVEHRNLHLYPGPDI